MTKTSLISYSRLHTNHRLSLPLFALVWICTPVIDGLLFGNSNRSGVHKGSILPNHRAGPNSAPAQRSLNRKPAPDANPGGRWVFQMQRSVLTRTRPPLTRSLLAQWTFFWARGAGGRGWARRWGCSWDREQLATGQLFSSTKDTMDESHLGWMSDSSSLNMATRKNMRLHTHMCFICKCAISSNLQLQITTC